MNILKKCLLCFAACFSILAVAYDKDDDKEISVTQQDAMIILNLETMVEKNRIIVTQKNATYTEVNCAKADAYVLSGINNDKDDNYGKVKKSFENHRALLISAYLSEKPVKLVLKGCASKRPRIISVTL